MSLASKDSFIFPFCACNLFSFYLPGHNGCIMLYGRIDIPVPIPEENVTSFTVEHAINYRGLSCSLKTVLLVLLVRVFFVLFFLRQKTALELILELSL